MPRLKVKLTKPGGCDDRIVTLVEEVKDSYGAMAICGGTSHPASVHACPTVTVLPFPGRREDLLKDLRAARSSMQRNLLSGSQLLAMTIAVSTAFGDKCQSPVSLALLIADMHTHCLSACLSIYLSIYLSVCLSVCLSISLSFYLSFSVSVYLSVCMYVCMSACLAA